MTVLWITLALAYILSFSARFVPNMGTLNNDNHTIKKPSKIFTSLVMAILILVSGLRNNIGDTYFYMLSYERNKFDLSMIKFEGDFGFNILQAILQNFTDDPQILIFVCALITNLLIVAGLYKYSGLYEIAIYVYFTSGAYLVSMNGIRQYLAAGIVFAGTHYLMKRDWKKYFVIVLLASTFHTSALLLLVAYFFVGGKAWRLRTFLILTAGLILMVGYQWASSIFFEALKDTQYGHYQDFAEGGASFTRVFVFSVPLLIAYLGRKKLTRISEYGDTIVNMSILGFLFMLISSQNWIFARVAIYFNLYQILLVSWVISLFDKRSQKIVYWAILFFYLIYCYREQVLGLDIQYHSNYIRF